MSRYALIPAFPFDARVWAEAAEGLRAVGHEVLTPDVGGLGDSELPAVAPSVDVMAEQVADFMDQAGWPSAHIAGISMGGYIAMAMLRLFPERVEGLGLICTKASMDSPSKRAERLQQADDMNSSALAVMARAMAVALIADDEPRSAQVQAWVSDQDPTAVAWSLRAMAARPDSLGVLRTAGSRLAVVVAGQVDPMVTAADVHQMAAALTDAGARPTVVTLAGVGHLAALEAPAAVVDALLTLSRRPPSD